jgi:hypothetical protein
MYLALSACIFFCFLDFVTSMCDAVPLKYVSKFLQIRGMINTTLKPSQYKNTPA